MDTHASVAEAIHQTAQCVNEALGHQHYPFEALIEALKMTGDISRSSVFDVMLVLQNFELAAPRLGDAIIKPIEKSSQWDISR
ncbi:condensation domain-containing protein [Vibrio sp. PP-XX7]